MYCCCYMDNIIERERKDILKRKEKDKGIGGVFLNYCFLIYFIDVM